MLQTRMTRQRSIILETLKATHSHPTADELYGMVREKLPRISLGTVYRNLEVLVESGEVLCLSKTGSQRRFDGDIKPHHHVRCSSCGKIGDIFTPVQNPEVAEDAVPGFSIQGVNVEFVGQCHECSTMQ